MEYIKNHWQEIIAAITGVMVAARLIVKLTPTPKDDSFLEKIIEWMKHLGLHIDSKK